MAKESLILENALLKINDACTGPNPRIAGVVCIAVDRNGDPIFSHTSGSTKLGGSQPMDFNSVFWLASCTKLLTGIASMQLVEQGKLSLDDAEQLHQIAPELRELKVLQKNESGGFSLVDQEKYITLRMLLTHTSGFSYAMNSFELCEWSQPVGLDDFSGRRDDILYRPLVFQPGTGVQYGVGIDWVGVVIERVAKISLEDYFQRFIFNPLEINNTSFFPSPDMISRLAYLHHRGPDGSLTVVDHILRYPLLSSQYDPRNSFCMGGCGCFGTAPDYATILAVLLNNGKSPKTHARLLRPETVEEMFTDQIPEFPLFHNEFVPSAKPSLANARPVIPKPGNPSDGWGLTFALSHDVSPTGRPMRSAWWEGLANVHWFVDRENGVAMILAAQVMPDGDFEVTRLYHEVEEEIYASLGLKPLCG
ncbi:hypothetical protein P175DRAFT_0483408 [Aspergillus ochraceoroseus IBT 24754]|uniref:Beta-lactamase-related domain-containing protein n=1 Tax=Aspergillus ochraceoroseus IBT 24754 TaxID=1392256 RepID=A0A2T5LTU3_9EURO|nr:uncharacterized protein P175DRAFT_0483408 [Aspergillus ochraceoroseus IBT 24754]PTU19699.1 hypothetical protein P175DRAFT_0483408 [Aspergillus ochraceoroseus IBT 24754]